MSRIRRPHYKPGEEDLNNIHNEDFSNDYFSASGSLSNNNPKEAEKFFSMDDYLDNEPKNPEGVANGNPDRMEID